MQTHGTFVAAVSLALCGAANAHSSVSPLTPSADVLEATDLQRGSIQRLELPAQAGLPFEVEVRLQGGVHSLLLEPHSVRAGSFQVLAQGPDGSFTAQEPGPSLTYRGSVVGADGSVVAASLIGGQLHGIVRLADDLPLQGIQPISEFDADAHVGDHVVYDINDMRPLDVFCGTDAFEPQMHPGAHGSGGTAAGGLKECEIAADADVEFYNLNSSSVTSTQADIENIINGVSAIYTADVGMTFALTSILVRTSEPDPYSSTNAGTLLNQFTNHWSGSQGGIQRDIAHLFTGKNVQGSTIGIAWLNSVCGNGNGYGVSQSKFTGNLASRVALTAHEIGHNFAAGHCNGASGCAIMCSGLGGCSGVITSFYSGSKNTISNKINSSNCIGDAGPADPPTLTNVTPAITGAYQDGDIVLSGSNFADVLSVTIGGEAMPSNKVLVSFGSITIVQPVIKSAGPQEVVVVTAAGVAGGQFITVLEETDVLLNAPGLSIPGTTYQLPWSGGAGNFYTVSFAFTPDTTNVGGLDLLTDGNVALSGFFGTAGTDTFTIPSVGSLGFLTLHFQALVIDAGSGSAVGASSVGTTTFL